MFGFHQTFALRGGNEDWLGKGIRKLTSTEPDTGPVFFQNPERAAEILGIGVNKIKSLKEWLRFTGLTEVKKKTGKAYHYLTPLGSLIARYDEDLEEIGTLWVLHYQLCSNADGATTWYWFWNEFVSTEFTREDMLQGLLAYTRGTRHEDISANTLKDDISALLATYAYQESVDSIPVFGDLRLLQETRKGVFRKQPGKRVPPLILAYVIADERLQRFPNGLDMSLSMLLRDPGGPGKLMQLEQTMMIELLDGLKSKYEGKLLGVTRTAGLDNVFFHAPIAPLAILTAYYWEEVEDKSLNEILTLFDSDSSICHV